MFLCNSVYSQNIVDELIQFNKNVDLDCFLINAQENINDYFILENENWGNDIYKILPQRIDLNVDEIVPMLTIKFVNTDKYNFGDDIYNYITIDSVIVFTLACVDKKMNVKAFAHFFDGVNGYYRIDNDPALTSKSKKQLKSVIKNINKQNPELLLYNHVLSGFSDNNGFMFIRHDKIYIYILESKNIYELNEYITSFFDISRIRNLNNSFIPLIYQNGE